MAMAHMKNKFRATTNLWLFFSTPAGAVSTGPNITSFCSKENGHTKCSGFGKANLAGILPSQPKKNLEHTPHASKTPNGRRHGAKHPPNDHWLAVGRISFWRSRLRAYFFRDTFGGKITETLSVPWTHLWWPTSNNIAILKWAIHLLGEFPSTSRLHASCQITLEN